MKFHWKTYCYENRLPSSSTKEDSYNHYLNNKKTRHNHSSVANKPCVHEIFPEALSENKNLLFLCHTIPTFDTDSGSKRMVEILKILIDLGYKIYYLTHDLHLENPQYLENLYNLGVTSVHGADKKNNKYCHDYIEELTIKEHIIFNVIIFEFYEMYTTYWDKIKYLIPNVKTIIDTVDVHWVRKLSNPSNTKSDIKKINIEKNREKEAYSKVNVVFAVTEEDKTEIAKACPGANVKILSNIHKIDENINPNKKEKNLIFVGGDNHTPNTIAAQKAIEIFDEFLKANPGFVDSKLHIVGKRTDKKILSYINNKNVIIHNQVSQTKLNNLYDICCGALCPITWGSGIKGKVCEAISKGLVIITTPVGASGLNLIPDYDALISENITHKMILKLFTMSNEKQKQMVDRCQKKLVSVAGIDSAKKVLEGTLTLRPIVLSIVTFNNEYLLQRCIESILSKTIYPNYKIYVTSNSCSGNTAKIMEYYTKKYSHIYYQYNTDNKHFIIANNETIKLFPDSDIVLLNDDIEFLSSCWLSDLYSAAYSAGYIGCSGGKTIYPDGTICEAGSIIYNDGNGENFGRHQDMNEPEFNREKYVGYVSGCLMYMRRDCIDKFGPLDIRYYPCYYEDSDWQYNLHINGYKTLYTPKVLAIHREGSSCGIDIDDEKGFKKFMKVNKIKFLEKYKNYNIESFN
jgi:GT2 family glycosyltransferase